MSADHAEQTIDASDPLSTDVSVAVVSASELESLTPASSAGTATSVLSLEQPMHAERRRNSVRRIGPFYVTLRVPPRTAVRRERLR